MDIVETAERLLRREEGWSVKEYDYAGAILSHECGLEVVLFRYAGSNDATIRSGRYTLDLSGWAKRRVRKAAWRVVKSLRDLQFTNNMIRKSQPPKKAKAK